MVIYLIINVPWISVLKRGSHGYSSYAKCSMHISLNGYLSENKCPMHISRILCVTRISPFYRCFMNVSLIIGVPWISLLYKCFMDVSL